MKLTRTNYSVLTVGLLVVGESLCVLVGLSLAMLSGFGSIPSAGVKKEALALISLIGVAVPVIFLAMLRWATVGVTAMWMLWVSLVTAVGLAGMLHELRVFIIVLAIVSLMATWILLASKKRNARAL